MPKEAPKFRLVERFRKVVRYDAGCKRDRADGKYYKTARWQKLRKVVLSNSPICVDCCDKLATDVDHIDGDASNMEMENLQALCRSCHSRKTARENGGFGNKPKK